MKNKFKKLPLLLFVFILISTFTFTLINNTTYALAARPSSHSSGKSFSTPKSGYKSSIFKSSGKSSSSTKSKSTAPKSTPKSGYKSSTFSNPSSKSSSTSSGSSTNKKSWFGGSSGGNTIRPFFIFFPHRTVYYDAYGSSHYALAGPSPFGIIADIIIIILIIWFIRRIFKRRR